MTGGPKAAVFVVAEADAPAIERVVAVVEGKGITPAQIAEGKARVQARFGIELGDIVCVPPGRLVRNSAGAVQRMRTRERLLDGSLFEREAFGALASRWVRRLIR